MDVLCNNLIVECGFKMKVPFYQSVWFTVAMLIVLPPLGIYLALRYSRWSIAGKAAASVLSALWFIILLAAAFSDGGTSDDPSTRNPSRFHRRSPAPPSPPPRHARPRRSGAPSGRRNRPPRRRKSRKRRRPRRTIPRRTISAIRMCSIQTQKNTIARPAGMSGGSSRRTMLPPQRSRPDTPPAGTATHRAHPLPMKPR